MRKYKSGFKNYISLLILVLIFCLGIGYAVINRTLTITGNTEVVKNTWDVHFDNVQVTNGSVEADSLPVIDTGTKTLISFNVMLNLPGDFYEFTIDVVNAGSIDAMIDSITKTPELTTEQAKYLNYIIEYQNGEVIQSKQLVKSNEFVRFKVRIEYIKDLNAEDLPTTLEVLNLAFSVNYVQSDGTGISVLNNGAQKVAIANGSLDTVGTIVTIGEEQFYIIGTDGDNVKLFSMMNITLDDNPIQSSSAGTTMFSNSTQHGTNYSDYQGSIAEFHVNNYKNEIVKKGVTVEEARLISKDELEDLGCDGDQSWCDNAPNWVYSISYWTSTADDSSYIWFVHNDGKLFWYDIYNTEDIYGIRPVIIIPKSEIAVERKIIEFNIDAITYQAEEGMTWGEWIDSEYNVDDYYYEGYIRLDTCSFVWIHNVPVSPDNEIVNGGYYQNEIEPC